MQAQRMAVFISAEDQRTEEPISQVRSVDCRETLRVVVRIMEVAVALESEGERVMLVLGFGVGYREGK